MINNVYLIPLLLVFLIGCNPFQKERPNLYRTFKCPQKMPEFTLTEKSNPSDSELNKLCDCIWDGLGDYRNEAESILGATENSNTSLQPSAGFMSKFGSLISNCKTSDY